MIILMFFSDSLFKNTLKNISNIVIVHSCSKFFFSIFYRNAKISTSCTAKSRCDREKQMSNSDLAAKKHNSSITYLKSFGIFAIVIISASNTEHIYSFCCSFLWFYLVKRSKPMLVKISMKFLRKGRLH